MKTRYREQYVRQMILRAVLVSVGLLAVLLASYGTENSVNAQDRHPAIINSCDASSSSILVDESITISARVHNRSVGVFGAVMYLEVEYYKDGKYITSFQTGTKTVGKGDRATFTDTTGIGEAGSYTAICYLRRDTGELLDLSDPSHQSASGFSSSPTFTVHSPNSAPSTTQLAPVPTPTPPPTPVPPLTPMPPGGGGCFRTFQNADAGFSLSGASELALGGFMLVGFYAWRRRRRR